MIKLRPGELGDPVTASQSGNGLRSRILARHRADPMCVNGDPSAGRSGIYNHAEYAKSCLITDL